MPTFHTASTTSPTWSQRFKRCHDAGIDPAFDNDLEELERQFAELRISQQP